MSQSGATRALVALAAAFATLGAAAAQPCGEGLPGAPRRLEGERYTVVFVTVPDPVPVGRHFVVDFAVCPRKAAALPGSVRVDAVMPEHRHGMNYRPSVTSPRPGVYRAEGLLFHMPGRWDLNFELLPASGDAERLMSTLHIE